MELIDRGKEFFLKKLLLPRIFRIDIPGYVVGRFYTLAGQSSFVRNFFLSEPFFVILERIVEEKLGRNGLSSLYRVGKEFGYQFISLNRISRSDILSSTHLIFSFFEALYAERITPEIDLSRKSLVLETKDMVITRINGGGLPLVIGGCAGIWSYMLDDFDNIECSVTKKGDKYILISGPKEVLKKDGMSFYEAVGKPSDFDVRYIKFNQPPKTIPGNSFNMDKLMKTDFFTYKEGELKFSLGEIRFVPVEISLPYKLEISVGEDIVFASAKESFFKMGKLLGKQKDSHIFLANMLTALGYGLVNVTNTKEGKIFTFNGYPWYPKCENSTMPILRGAVEGFLEAQLDVKVLTQAKTKVLNNVFLVSIGVKYE